ncbi:hypothetical protein Hanom_Chr03g00276211 [Helianthus anomalus]
MLLFIFIFEGTLFLLYKFLIYFESNCECIEVRKGSDKCIKKYYYLIKTRKKIAIFSVIIGQKWST